ncbi:peptidoglycan/LPS O-acetylase OafA/YrhL [Bradyrhizobium elkanii]
MGPIHRRRPDLKALTGLRGLAAAIVALAHFKMPMPYYLNWPNAAVDLFFCLSGFTLAYAYPRNSFQFSNFMVARIARLYPLYLLTLVITGAMWLFLAPANYLREAAVFDLVLQLPLLNSWPIIGSGVHWNTPAWSISVEWFCYILLFPILLQLRAPRSVAAKLLCIMGLSTAAHLMFTNYFDVRTLAVQLYVPESQWSYWVNLCRGGCGFTAGWIVFASFEKRDGLYVFCTRYSAAIWAGFVVILTLGYYGLVASQAVLFLLPLIVLAATAQTSASSRLLASHVLHFLGLISYSVYMVHLIVFAVFVRFAPDHWPVLTYTVLIVTTLVVSTVTYFKIEVPARDAIRRLAHRRSTAPEGTEFPEPAAVHPTAVRFPQSGC